MARKEDSHYGDPTFKKKKKKKKNESEEAFVKTKEYVWHQNKDYAGGLLMLQLKISMKVAKKKRIGRSWSPNWRYSLVSSFHGQQCQE